MDKAFGNAIHVCYNDYAHSSSSSFLSSSQVYTCILVSLPSLSSSHLSLRFIDGDTVNHIGDTVGSCDEVGEGDRVMMEVDLRGERRERTLHFFVEGKQQKIYFYNLPSTVEFCVCITLLF